MISFKISDIFIIIIMQKLIWLKFWFISHTVNGKLGPVHCGIVIPHRVLSMLYTEQFGICSCPTHAENIKSMHIMHDYYRNRASRYPKISVFLKVRVNQKLLPTLFQCSDVFPAETEYWTEGVVLFLHSSSLSLTHSNLTVGGVCLRIFCHHQRRNAIPERKQMFRFWLKITKTNYIFLRINLHWLSSHQD